MFSVEFLNEIRAHELEQYLAHFPKGSHILEIGGGTGVQAKLIADLGFTIESIDVEQSVYIDDKVYPVKLYDGETIPFPDGSFDIIFSSNVLEHIPHINEFEGEMARVLKKDGVCVHAMPTGAWTFWTMITHYLNILQQLGRSISAERYVHPTNTEVQPAGNQSRILRRLRILPRLAVSAVRVLWHTLKSNRGAVLPNRHGEAGNVLTELYTFSAVAWKRHFRQCHYEIISAEPMGLFYTGYMFFGAQWPLKSRERWSRFLGSACVLYKVRPKEVSHMTETAEVSSPVHSS